MLTLKAGYSQMKDGHRIAHKTLEGVKVI